MEGEKNTVMQSNINYNVIMSKYLTYNHNYKFGCNKSPFISSNSIEGLELGHCSQS